MKEQQKVSKATGVSKSPHLDSNSSHRPLIGVGGQWTQIKSLLPKNLLPVKKERSSQIVISLYKNVIRVRT